MSLHILLQSLGSVTLDIPTPAAEKEVYEKKQKALKAIAMPILQSMGGAGVGGMPDICGMPGPVLYHRRN